MSQFTSTATQDDGGRVICTLAPYGYSINSWKDVAAEVRRIGRRDLANSILEALDTITPPFTVGSVWHDTGSNWDWGKKLVQVSEVFEAHDLEGKCAVFTDAEGDTEIWALKDLAPGERTK